MEIFNYKQFITEAKRFKDTGQIDLFAGSGTEYDSSPGVGAHLVTNLATQSQPQAQLEPEAQTATQSGTQSQKQILSEKIATQKLFLCYDLGFYNAIEKVLDPIKTTINFNPEKQKELKIIHDSGKYQHIYHLKVTNRNGFYESLALKNVKLVLDKDGNYDPVNKLNTNWFDTADLIVDIIDSNGDINDFINLNYYKMKDALKSYFQDKDLTSILKKFNLREYVVNNRQKSLIGEEAENFVKECFMAKGLTCVFQGGDGDPIDMRYGIDLIMQSPSGNYSFVQVKSAQGAAEKAYSEGKYIGIDFFCSPIDDNNVRKTILYDAKNHKTHLFTNTPRK